MVNIDKFVSIARDIIARPYLDMPDYLPLCADYDIPRNGLSSPSILALLYHAMQCADNDSVYGEAGMLCGLTTSAVISSLRGEQTIFSVDTMEQLPRYNIASDDPLIMRVLQHERVTFAQQDIYDFYRKFYGIKFSVYLYDAGHSLQDTYTALGMMRYHLTDNALVFIDDTNWDGPRTGVELACYDFGYEKIFDITTPVTAHPTFWNGLIILKWSGK